MAARLWAGGIRAEYLATDALVRWVIDGDRGMQMLWTMEYGIWRGSWKGMFSTVLSFFKS